VSTEVQLRPADIKGQLRHIMRRRDEPRPVALFGTGAACQVEVEGVIWDVRPVGCELELRAALTGTEHDTAVAFLMDYDDRLPLDVACRLAGQKVHPVDRRARLANLFGARKVAPGFAATALADVLLEELPDVPAIAGTLLQPDDAWRRYLFVRLNLPLETPPDVASLLRIALDKREEGVQFGRRRDDEGWGRLLEEAATWLERKAGPAARAVWAAWTSGTTPDLVAWLVHLDAARRANDKHATKLLRMMVRVSQGADETWLDESLAAPLCGALKGLLESLEASALREVLRRAGQLFDDPDFAAARRASPWLEEGFDALQDELASALEAALRGLKGLPTALQVFRDLEEHHLANSGASAERVHQVRSAAVRLTTWLAWLEKKPLPDEPGWTCMSSLARWYDEEGGWVDWAREELRTQTTNHAALDEAHRQVLERADHVRRGLDRRFAHATQAWYAAGKPATEVLPIERVTRDVAAAFLEEPNRRLLVVLLDGMSVSVATRLLEGQDGWAPVMWNPGKHRKMPPAIASLPSVTATSRAAFFAGKHEPRFGGESESKDPSRFADNVFLRDFAGTPAGPRLFLKPDLGSSNELAKPLLDALRDEGERVVAVVVNAIDDQLKGSDQITIPYEQPHSIPVLERLLQVARETERAVLLVSDHGHIPAHVMKGNKPPEGTKANGHRWRSLGPGQAPQEGEVELPDGCWKPHGVKSSALFWDERRAWGNAVFGAHGGLTLAEVVIPVRLIAPDWLFTVMQPPDDNLRTQEQRPPRWWRLEAPPPTSKRKVAAPPPLPTPQPTLFPTAPPPRKPAETPEVTFELHPLASALAKSELYKAKTLGQQEDRREMAIMFVDALLRAPGYAMPRAAFARAVGIKARRVTGRIADLGFLNADGFTVLEDDAVAKQVRLHFDRLIAQYGLDP